MGLVGVVSAWSQCVWSLDLAGVISRWAIGCGQWVWPVGVVSGWWIIIHFTS